MKQIERIRQLAEQSICDTKEDLSKNVLETIEKEVLHLKKLSEEYGHRKLYNLTNFDIFSLYMRLANYNMPFYERLDTLLEENKNVINKWTYNEEGRTIFDIVKYKNIDEVKDKKTLDELRKTGLSDEMIYYFMGLALQAVFTFLKYKSEVEQCRVVITQLVRSSSTMMDDIRDKAFEISYMKKMINAAVRCLKDEKEYNQKHISNMRNRMKCCKDLIECIEKGVLDRILAIPDEWHMYLDATILEELYNIIHQNLYVEYKKMLAEENKINDGIDENELKRYLFEKGLDYNSLDEKTRSQLTHVSDVVGKIKYLEDLGIDINIILTKYIDFLINFDDEKIKFINSLIKVGALTKKTLRDNLLVVIEKYAMIQVNYQILKDIIDFSNIFYKDTVLLIDSHKLQRILSVLKEYSLTKNNFMFLLCNFEYIDIYDLMLEHQIPLELFISICHTGEPVNTIKRIIVFKNIGEEYETVNHRLKKDVILDSKFDDVIDEYLDDVIPYLGIERINGSEIGKVVEEDIVKSLDSKYRRCDVYVIGDVRISRNKFLRNYQKIGKNGSVIKAMLSNSIIDSGGYVSLHNELVNKNILTKHK